MDNTQIKIKEDLRFIMEELQREVEDVKGLMHILNVAGDSDRIINNRDIKALSEACIDKLCQACDSIGDINKIIA
jgi:hypothetical protein